MKRLFTALLFLYLFTLSSLAIPQTMLGGSAKVGGQGVVRRAAGGGSTGDPFVTSQALSGSQSDGTWVGFYFTATGAGNVVTDLGRVFITGNSTAETVYLYGCGSGLPPSGCSLMTSVSVPASGVNDEYTYAAVSPQSLTNGNHYIVISSTSATSVSRGFGGVFTVNTGVTLSMGAASLGGSCYSINGGTTFFCNDNSGAGNVAYGSVNFKSYD